MDTASKKFTAEFEPMSASKILEPWDWLLHHPAEVFIVTALGDALFSNSAGEVFWLDVGAGEVLRVADNRAKFDEVMSAPDAIADVYLPDLTCELLEEHGPLATGTCFSPVIPYSLGGKPEPANFQVMEINAHFRSLAKIQRQVAELPVGTKIDRVVNERDEDA
jgi:hypothetical protein